MIVMLISSASAWADNAPALDNTQGLRPVTLTATAGDSYKSFEGCDNIFDGDIYTKWCGTVGSDSYVEFNSVSPFVPKAYTLVTANDNSEYQGRNPSSWKLLAKNTGDTDWTTIVDVKDCNAMEDVNYTPYHFAIPNTVSTAYQYYRFVVSKVNNTDKCMQLSELSLWRETLPDEPVYSISLPSNIEHGTVSATVGGSATTTAYEGDDVCVTIEWEDGYELDDESFSINDASNNRVKCSTYWDDSFVRYTFKMPANGVIVNAAIRKKQYFVETGPCDDMFRIEASPISAEAGETVTLTVTKNSSVVLDELTAYYKTIGKEQYNVRRGYDTDKKLSGYTYLNLIKVDDTHYTFVMPSENVQVSAKIHYEGSYAFNLADGISDEAVKFYVGGVEAKSANVGDKVMMQFNTIHYENVSVKGSSVLNIENNFFTMPAEDVTVSADLTYILDYLKPWYYAIDIIVDNKVVSENNSVLIKPGKTVTMKVKCSESSMILSFWDITTYNGINQTIDYSDIVESSEEGYPHVYTCTFEMPYSNISTNVYLGSPITVSFVPNGGHGTMADITIGCDGFIYLPECAFEAPDGYEFAGWKMENYEELKSAGERVGVGTSNTTIVAQWKESVLELANAADNSDVIQKANGKVYSRVTLTGRTLYKDGDWNTICLPFDVSGDDLNNNDNPLHCSTIMELDVESKESDGITPKTRLDNNGTLYLAFTTVYDYFYPSTGLKAGKPYIIKWAKADGYDQADPETRDLKDPVFNLVAIKDLYNVVKADGFSFKGTYDQLIKDSENKDYLFLGANNKLYYPQPDLSDDQNPKYASIGAFRAYFRLNDSQCKVKEFKLSFGEDEETSITPALSQGEGEQAVYDLSGRKIANGQRPTAKGLYIVNGKKILK